MQLLEIMLAGAGSLITLMLSIIGFFLTQFYKENKKQNNIIITDVKNIQSTISEIKAKGSVQDKINAQLMEKDNEIWAELKAILLQSNESADNIKKIFENQQQQIHDLDIRLNSIESEHKLFHINKASK